MIELLDDPGKFAVGPTLPAGQHAGRIGFVSLLIERQSFAITAVLELLLGAGQELMGPVVRLGPGLRLLEGIVVLALETHRGLGLDEFRSRRRSNRCGGGRRGRTTAGYCFIQKSPTV